MEIYGRRHDINTAHLIQCGITLLSIAGAAEARRYLSRHNIANATIERVLSGTPKSRREIDPPGRHKA